MELREFIEQGAAKAGSLTALGKILDLDQRNMTSAKAHRRGIPSDVAIKLADYIGADRIDVISANELATEKKPEKQEFWRSLLSAPKTGQLSYIRQIFQRLKNWRKNQAQKQRLVTCLALSVHSVQSF